jgi:CBS domain-containing protein
MGAKVGLTARDVMSRDLVTVTLGTTLRGLAMILEENRISGAPVVDEAGHLIGVVSQSDLVRFDSHTAAHARLIPVEERTVCGDEAVEGETEDPRHPYYTHLDAGDIGPLRERFIEEDYGDALVSDIYTPFTITATMDTPVATLARLMVDQEVHRLIILDGKRVAGIVTSMDLLRTVAHPRPRAGRPVLMAH